MKLFSIHIVIRESSMETNFCIRKIIKFWVNYYYIEPKILNTKSSSSVNTAMLKPVILNAPKQERLEIYATWYFWKWHTMFCVEMSFTSSKLLVWHWLPVVPRGHIQTGSSAFSAMHAPPFEHWTRLHTSWLQSSERGTNKHCLFKTLNIIGRGEAYINESI